MNPEMIRKLKTLEVSGAEDLDAFWSVIRGAVSRNDAHAVCEAVRVLDGETLVSEEGSASVLTEPWGVEYNETAQVAVLTDFGKRIDEAFRIFFGGREARFELMAARTLASPRSKKPGIQRWCKAEADAGRIDYGPVGFEVTFRTDWTVFLNTKLCAHGTAVRRLQDASREVHGNSFGSGRRRKRKKDNLLSAREARNFVAAALNEDERELACVHIALGALTGRGLVKPEFFEESVNWFWVDALWRTVSARYAEHVAPVGRRGVRRRMP